jgi:hypothetical protein
MKYDLAESAGDIPMDHVVTHLDKVVSQSGIGSSWTKYPVFSPRSPVLPPLFEFSVRMTRPRYNPTHVLSTCRGVAGKSDSLLLSLGVHPSDGKNRGMWVSMCCIEQVLH